MADLVTLDWEGKRYELEVDSVTAREFKSIKQHTGLKAGQFVRSLTNMEDLDADVAVALLWLFKTRAGEPADFDENLQVFKLLAAITPAAAYDEESDPKG